MGYYYHYGEEGKGEEGKEEGKERERERFNSLGIFPNFRSNFAEENNITE